MEGLLLEQSYDSVNSRQNLKLKYIIIARQIKSPASRKKHTLFLTGRKKSFAFFTVMSSWPAVTMLFSELKQYVEELCFLIKQHKQPMNRGYYYPMDSSWQKKVYKIKRINTSIIFHNWFIQKW